AWGDGQIVLTMSVAIGGARLALEKALGPSARAGNEQVRLLLRGLGDRWREELVRTLERLAAFQRQVESLAPPRS
ncbi:MAG: hypothetical protein Q8O40_02835, partial [Chloroflexota bacterium]|nr:hypothetical protein [Chloroflexota bacterium]